MGTAHQDSIHLLALLAAEASVDGGQLLLAEDHGLFRLLPVQSILHRDKLWGDAGNMKEGHRTAGSNGGGKCNQLRHGGLGDPVKDRDVHAADLSGKEAQGAEVRKVFQLTIHPDQDVGIAVLVQVVADGGVFAGQSGKEGRNAAPLHSGPQHAVVEGNGGALDGTHMRAEGHLVHVRHHVRRAGGHRGDPQLALDLRLVEVLPVLLLGDLHFLPDVRVHTAQAADGRHLDLDALLHRAHQKLRVDAPGQAAQALRLIGDIAEGKSDVHHFLGAVELTQPHQEAHGLLTKLALAAFQHSQLIIFQIHVLNSFLGRSLPLFRAVRPLPRGKLS